MQSSGNVVTGDLGEREIINRIACPNCHRKLMLLPKNYPLFDIQCTACYFRAQVKSANSKPRNIVRGAGWDIMNKVLKSGSLVPPLITNNKWVAKGRHKQEIRFYPFIGKDKLVSYQADIKSQKRQYKMFNYHLNGAQYYKLFER